MDREIGRGTLWTFSTSNCEATYKELRSKGVNFIQEPVKGEFGIEAIFEDLYENRFSILEIQ
jgi:predicted enzyme related to lactoylglutathione lyase